MSKRDARNGGAGAGPKSDDRLVMVSYGEVIGQPAALLIIVI